MDILVHIIQTIAVFFGCLGAILSIFLFLRLHWPAPALWLIKLYTSALSPLFVLIGIFIIIAGITTGSILICLIGIYTVLIYCIHVILVTRPPASSNGFEKAFGPHWQEKIAENIKHRFLPSRVILKLPAVPDPDLRQNFCFVTIPGTDRKLLCDIWEPPPSVTRSGLAFIYLHGSAWYFLDKDLGTRPLFRHLAAQGHVIMDLAYRLAPETDMMGMIHDVQRAVVWMKEQAATYKVNPNRIIAGGGSAGGHLAFLAAYTSGNAQFTAKELAGKDLSIRAVISLYGPTNLEAMYYHTNQHLTTRSTPGRPQKKAPAQMPAWVIKKMGKEYYRLGMDKGFENAGSFAPLLGGHPDEIPGTYTLFSPVTHVHPGCPPALLIHGEHDIMAPVKNTRLMYQKLQEKKVQSVMHILPQTDHAFDLQLPGLSPSAHNAIYDVERFLALMV